MSTIINAIDSVGNQILIGDIVRVFHFQTGRKKYYMYKKLQKIEVVNNVVYYVFEHLDSCGTYRARSFGQFDNCVVVQRGQFHNDPKLDELKRNPKMRD